MNNRKTLIVKYVVFNSFLFAIILLLSACRNNPQANFVLGYVQVNAHLPNNGTESHTSDGTNVSDVASGTITVMGNNQRAQADGNDEGNSPQLSVPLIK